MVKRIFYIGGLVILLGLFTKSTFAVQDGVTELQIGQGINGAVLGASLTLGSKEWVFGIPFTVLTTTGGALYPNAFAESNKVTPASSHLINFMSLWGITTGLTLGASFNQRGSRSLAWGVFWLDLAATLSANMLVANKYKNITNGQTGQIISGWLYGAGLAALLASSPLFDKVRDSQVATYLFWGQLIGLGGGFLFAESINMSRKRVLLLDFSLLGGFFAGYGAASLFTKSHNMRWLIGVMGLASAAVASMVATKHWPQESREGNNASGDTQLNLSLPSMRFGF